MEKDNDNERCNCDRESRSNIIELLITNICNSLNGTKYAVKLLFNIVLLLLVIFNSKAISCLESNGQKWLDEKFEEIHVAVEKDKQAEIDRVVATAVDIAKIFREVLDQHKNEEKKKPTLDLVEFLNEYKNLSLDEKRENLEIIGSNIFEMGAIIQETCDKIKEGRADKHEDISEKKTSITDIVNIISSGINRKSPEAGFGFSLHDDCDDFIAEYMIKNSMDKIYNNAIKIYHDIDSDIVDNGSSEAIPSNVTWQRLSISQRMIICTVYSCFNHASLISGIDDLSAENKMLAYSIMKQFVFDVIKKLDVISEAIENSINQELIDNNYSELNEHNKNKVVV